MTSELNTSVLLLYIYIYIYRLSPPVKNDRGRDRKNAALERSESRSPQYKLFILLNSLHVITT